MGILYSPLLVITAFLEVLNARRIRWNLRRGEAEDDYVQEWEHVAEELNFEVDDTWKQCVEETKPNAYVDASTLEVMQLKEQVAELTSLVKSLVERGDVMTGSSAM